MSPANIHLICLNFIRFELVKHHTRSETRSPCRKDQAIDQARLQTLCRLCLQRIALKYPVAFCSRRPSVVPTPPRRSLQPLHVEPPPGLHDRNLRPSSRVPHGASFEAMRESRHRQMCQPGQSAPVWCPGAGCPLAQPAHHRRTLQLSHVWYG